MPSSFPKYLQPKFLSPKKQRKQFGKETQLSGVPRPYLSVEASGHKAFKEQSQHLRQTIAFIEQKFR